MQSITKPFLVNWAHWFISNGMKKKELQEYKSKSPAEMGKDLHGLREKLVGLRFDLASGKVKNIKEIKQAKKSIAQILTVLKNKKT